DGAPAEGYRAPRRTESSTDSVDCRADSATDSAESAESAADSVRVELRASSTRPAPIAVLTGEYGARVLAPLADDLAAAARGPLRVVPVENRFFGGNIAVTGLLTGPDVARVLDAAPAGE